MKPKLFLGSSQEAVDASAVDLLASALKEGLPDLEIVVWNTTNWENLQSALKTLTESLADYAYAVFLAWPDDILKLRDESYYCCRDNVIFELGLFLTQLGTNRTFLVAPPAGCRIFLTNNIAEGLPFRIHSDIAGVFHAAHYIINSPNSKIIAEFRIEDLLSKIKEIEKLRSENEKKSRKQLQQCVKEARVVLEREDQADAYYLNHLRSVIGLIVELKARATSKSISEAALDILIFLDDVEDICDIKQLAKVQLHSNNDNLGKVWIFADKPLEFQTDTDESSIDELKQTICENLLKGVEYTYFVSSREAIKLDLLIPNDTSKDNVETMKKNMLFIIVDKRLFKTYFTLHFRKGSSRPFKVYMSALRKDRTRDILLQIADPSHIDRICTNLQLWRGHDYIHQGVNVVEFFP